jgi:KipI family sensor histidine kinase inhibitor
VECGDDIDPVVNDRVLALAAAVDEAATIGVRDVVPTFNAVTVHFDPIQTDPDALNRRLLDLAVHTASSHAPALPHTVTVPVHYGGEDGPDLEELSERVGLTPLQVVQTHTSVLYRVYMLGFSPGFPYLGTVPDQIAIPRLDRPRQKVPAGSVGIAGKQTGIYPQESPGGWRVIGRTPLKLFDPERSDPFLLNPGDRVKFVAIDRGEFARFKRKSH